MIGTVSKIRLRLRNALVSRALILAYHRVCPATGLDPFRLQVSPANFAEHLKVLKDHYRILSLGELAARVERHQLPHRSVVLTFDDGYLDNLIHARPLLEQLGVPATVFVASGYVGKPGFWWDRLLRVVFSAHVIPAEIHLHTPGCEPWTFRLEDVVDLNRPANETGDAEARRACYMALWRRIRRERFEVKDNLMNELECQLPGSTADVGETRPCNDVELKQLVSGGPISLGAHSVTHPVLADLSANDQAFQMTESRRQLEEIAGVPVLDFSYPHGTPEDIDASSVKQARESGFRSACTAISGVVEANATPHVFPRIGVANIDGGAFERLMIKHFNWTSSTASSAGSRRDLAG